MWKNLRKNTKKAEPGSGAMPSFADKIKPLAMRCDKRAAQRAVAKTRLEFRQVSIPSSVYQDALSIYIGIPRKDFNGYFRRGRQPPAGEGDGPIRGCSVTAALNPSWVSSRVRTFRSIGLTR